MSPSQYSTTTTDNVQVPDLLTYKQTDTQLRQYNAGIRDKSDSVALVQNDVRNALEGRVPGLATNRATTPTGSASIT